MGEYQRHAAPLADLLDNMTRTDHMRQAENEPSSHKRDGVGERRREEKGNTMQTFGLRLSSDHLDGSVSINGLR